MQRNIIIIAILVLGFSTTAMAQIQVGVLGGMNLSDFHIPKDNPFDADYDDFLRNDVFGTGVLCEFPLGSIFSLRTQLMVLQKSCTYQQGLDQGYTYNLLYLELPLFIKIAVGKKFRPYLLMGPSIGYRIKAKADVHQGVAAGTSDLKNITPKMDFSAMAGGGISYALGKFTLFVEALYVRSYKNINKGGDIDIDIGGFTITQEVDPLEVKPFGTHIIAGVTYPLGGSK